VFRVVLASLALACLTSCLGTDPNLTEAGLGKPFLSVDFPTEASAGSTEELLVEIDNPGPGDMSSFTVAFANVAVGGTVGNASPLLRPAPPPRRIGDDQQVSPSIASIEPEPVTVGEGGLVFRFGPLPEEASATASFEVVMPEEPQTYANSVQVFDSQVLDRIDAVKVQVEVVD
jgi:hypothetical protein